MKNKNSGKSAKMSIFRKPVSFLLSIIAVFAFIIMVNLTTGMRESGEGSENKVTIDNQLSKPDLSADNFSIESSLHSSNMIKDLQDELSAKDEELAGLKREISVLRSENEVRAAGIGSIAGDIILMLLFSVAASLVAAYVMKRRTRQLCHCHIRRLKIIKQRNQIINS